MKIPKPLIEVVKSIVQLPQSHRHTQGFGTGIIIPLIDMEMYGIEQLKESCFFAASKYCGPHVGDTVLQLNYEWCTTSI